jgi:protein SCO1/2
MVNNKARIALFVLIVTAMTSFGWVAARLTDLGSERSGQVAAESGLGRAGATFEEAPGGPFALTDHRGRPVTERDYHGKFVLISFGYTFCPDVCPTTLFGVSQVLDLLGQDAGQVQAIFVTIDPERDTAEVLAEYVANFHPGIVGLTGTAEQIRAIAEAYGVGYRKVASPEAGDDGYLMNHGAAIDLMDPEGNYLASFPYIVPAEQLAAVIRNYIHGINIEGVGT